MLLQTQKRPRLQLIDILRGVALIGMVIYHFSWDLAFYGYLPQEIVSQGGFRLLARCVASAFLFLAGFSLYLAHADAIRWQFFWRRMVIIAATACLITVVTYFIIPDQFIYFGILHEIALASLVGLVFLKTPIMLNIVVTAAVFITPCYFQPFSNPMLYWLGLSETPRFSADYVPFFPWFSAALAGLTLAKIMNRYALLHWLQPGIRPQFLNIGLQWSGRHSLLLYIAHQPVLLALLFCVSLIFPPSPIDVKHQLEQECSTSCPPEYSVQYCARFCRCITTELDSRNLLQNYLNGKLSADDEQIRQVQNFCSVFANTQREKP